MLNSEPLVPLGLAVIALTACLIVIPYLRGKSDALTAWNLVLLGGAIFVGVGCLEVAYGVIHWSELQWFQPTKRNIDKFMLGTLVFYATLLFTYYVLIWLRKLVAHFFNKWPQQSTNWEFFALALCLGLTVLTLIFNGVPVLNSLFGNISQKAALFASVISFSIWYRNKVNVAALDLFLWDLRLRSAVRDGNFYWAEIAALRGNHPAHLHVLVEVALSVAQIQFSVAGTCRFLGAGRRRILLLHSACQPGGRCSRKKFLFDCA